MLLPLQRKPSGFIVSDDKDVDSVGIRNGGAVRTKLRVFRGNGVTVCGAHVNFMRIDWIARRRIREIEDKRSTLRV